MDDLKADAKVIHELVEFSWRVLNYEWDPIGIFKRHPEQRDTLNEYELEASELVRMAIEGADVNAMAARLVRLRNGERGIWKWKRYPVHDIDLISARMIWWIVQYEQYKGEINPLVIQATPRKNG